MPQIKSLHAREILDSRGNPTVAVTVHLNNGISAEAAVPSGASTGQHEALELRDRDPARYRGAGVRQAVEHVNGELAAALAGMPVNDQERIDAAMCRLDGTPNKSRLGANAMLGVSLAAARAAAAAAGVPLYQHLGGQEACILPVPMINVLNAGCHSSAPIAFQEFMLRPVGLPCFREAVRAGAEIFQALRSLLKKRGFSTAVGDEGGFAPTLAGGTREALELLLEAIGSAGYAPGREISLALDCAASEFYRDGLYDYTLFEGQTAARRDAAAQAEFLQSLIDAYPIDSIEDGMAEEDWDGWKLLTDRIGHRCQLVGDDLFVTNVEFLGRGIERVIANAILIKVNQIGTLSETMAAIRMAEKAGYGVVISHRSGETEDTTIADLAVAVNAGQIKCGSLSRSERVAKYNRLLWIEEQLGPSARYGRQP